MQLTFEGKTIDQLAIELIQAYEPPEGYFLGFSGGIRMTIKTEFENLIERCGCSKASQKHTCAPDKCYSELYKLVYPNGNGTAKSHLVKRDCACNSDDAYMCYRLRYPKDVENCDDLGLPSPYCTCPCHGEQQEDNEDYD